MPAPQPELKAKARELLPPAIAEFVEVAIDADVSAPPRPPGSRPLPQARPEGIGTLYLGDAFYAGLGLGRFQGRPTVQWNGMDSFVFLQDTAAPFSYTTARGRIIAPNSMSTDGGTIPRIFQVLRKFSPWGYGPSFVIHDWLFAAHRGALAPDADWAFEDTAMVLAESMKSLMETGFVNADRQSVRLEKAEDTLYRSTRRSEVPSRGACGIRPSTAPRAFR
jgi:hypothetical protein